MEGGWKVAEWGQGAVSRQPWPRWSGKKRVLTPDPREMANTSSGSGVSV